MHICFQVFLGQLMLWRKFLSNFRGKKRKTAFITSKNATLPPKKCSRVSSNRFHTKPRWVKNHKPGRIKKERIPNLYSSSRIHYREASTVRAWLKTDGRLIQEADQHWTLCLQWPFPSLHPITTCDSREKYTQTESHESDPMNLCSRLIHRNDCVLIRTPHGRELMHVRFHRWYR